MHKQKQAIDLATARLTFLDAHAKAVGIANLCDSANRVRDELNAALLYYSWRDALTRRSLPARIKYSRWSYRLATLTEWIFIVVYCLSCVGFIIGSSNHRIDIVRMGYVALWMLFLLFSASYFFDIARVEKYRPDKPVTSGV